MALASRVDFAAAFQRTSVLLLALAVGAAGALIAVFGSIYGVTRALGACVVVPLVALIVLRPRLGVVVLIFAFGFFEEFPGGLSDQVVERSTRLPFYSLTFGLPAIYPPDVFIGGLLGLFLARKLLWREGYGLRLDKIGAGLGLLVASMAISIVVAMLGEEPLGPEVLDLSLLGAIKLPEAAARYIAVLQIKLFMLLFLSYVLGLIYFRTDRDVQLMIAALGLAMVATIALGSLRLYQDPGMVRKLIAVIYDTGTVTLMALAVFYVISKWACGHYNLQQTLVRALFVVALMLLILLSFRRTLWGAIALVLPLLPFMVPAKARGRILALMALGAFVAGAALASFPAGRALVESVIARAEETHLNDPSTLYRFSLLVWVVERFGELPMFGWGIKPLWNETVHIRFFASNMENVHSLYFWILVRFGIVGVLVSTIAMGLALLRIVEVWRRIPDDHYRILLMVVLVSIVLYLFGGIFNPVYANVRLVVPLGFALALVTRLPEIAARSAGEKR